MRYIIGTIGVIAALSFVGYAAVTSFETAASMTTQFPELAGTAAAGMVIWEALGALFVQQCWRNGSRLMAVGGAILVLAASVYLLRIDLRFHVTGQSDLAATREVGIENREMARAEHAKAIARRDGLQKIKAPTAYERSQLDEAVKRIAQLEPKLWSAETVNAGGVPEAGWASRMLSGISSDRQWWTDILMVVGMLFWALARMLALPVAVASMQAAARPREAHAAAWASAAPEVAGITVPPALVPTLSATSTVKLMDEPKVDDEPRDPPPSGSRPDPKAPRLGDLGRKHDAGAIPQAKAPAAQLATVHPIKPKVKMPIAEAPAETIIADWIGECVTATGSQKDRPSAGDFITSLDAYCERERAAPIDQQKMTAALNEALKVEKAGKRWPRNSKERIWPGYRVDMPAAERLRATA